MKLKNQFEPIRTWAEAKGIYNDGDIKTQTIKLGEEFGELCNAILYKDDIKIWDAIGDCVIVLTSIAYLSDMPIEKCINEAFNQIKNRQGKIVDGDFQKDF